MGTSLICGCLFLVSKISAFKSLWSPSTSRAVMSRSIFRLSLAKLSVVSLDECHARIYARGSRKQGRLACPQRSGDSPSISRWGRLRLLAVLLFPALENRPTLNTDDFSVWRVRELGEIAILRWSGQPSTPDEPSFCSFQISKLLLPSPGLGPDVFLCSLILELTSKSSLLSTQKNGTSDWLMATHQPIQWLNN